jgi:hypothetical protein
MAAITRRRGPHRGWTGGEGDREPPLLAMFTAPCFQPNDAAQRPSAPASVGTRTTMVELLP